MIGFHFSHSIPPPEQRGGFETLLKLFLQLLTYSNGNVADALAWMNELDRRYSLGGDNYGIGDFSEDLKKNGYIKENPINPNEFVPSAKSEQHIRKSALEEIFGSLKKAQKGTHSTSFLGLGGEKTSERKKFAFGDTPEHIEATESLRNAQIRHGIGEFSLTEDDLEIAETEHKAQTSTVLMIDVSHSMILYGEDRITPAKKVAMALAELIMRQYPGDTIDLLAFGDDAWQIAVKDLPYLSVGPYHTNTVAGLELAMDILRRRKTKNKQIFMITDGKPTCLKEGAKYYKNSFGLDRKILNKTLSLATQCRRLSIPITTFMVASDPYLQQFVREFTETNRGRAFYSSLEGLGNYIFEDYIRNRRRNIRS